MVGTAGRGREVVGWTVFRACLAHGECSRDFTCNFAERPHSEAARGGRVAEHASGCCGTNVGLLRALIGGMGRMGRIRRMGPKSDARGLVVGARGPGCEGCVRLHTYKA